MLPGATYQYQRLPQSMALLHPNSFIAIVYWVRHRKSCWSMRTITADVLLLLLLLCQSISLLLQLVESLLLEAQGFFLALQFSQLGI